ncbi:MAG: glycosyltransferase family 87 protein [Saprospiraceae bacterium]
MQTFWKRESVLWLTYLLVALVVSVHTVFKGPNAYGYTSYENYVIFKNSFSHLTQGLNPYAPYPAVQWDLFKYSPAFSLSMAPFSVLPDVVGLALWNLVNTIPLLWGVLRLPVLAPAQRYFVAWFVLPELIVSLQNSQSNGLTVALVLWAWIALERKSPVQGAWWSVAGGFLKIFGIFAAVPALIYPRQARFALATVAWTALMVAVPLVVVSPEQLWQVYGWWIELLRSDHNASVGLSVMGWLQTWFGLIAPKTAIMLIGLGLLLACTWSVFRRGRAAPDGLPPETDRIRLWSALLLWMVVFNHKAESPTFVIALCGVALWYQSLQKPVIWERILLWTAFVLASVSPTDIFPRALREALVQPYVLKAVPCIAIWAVLTATLLRSKNQQQAFDDK